MSSNKKGTQGLFLLQALLFTVPFQFPFSIWIEFLFPDKQMHVGNAPTWASLFFKDTLRIPHRHVSLAFPMTIG